MTVSVCHCNRPNSELFVHYSCMLCLVVLLLLLLGESFVKREKIYANCVKMNHFQAHTTQ